MKTFKEFMTGAAGLVAKPFVWDEKSSSRWSAYFFINDKKFVVTLSGLYNMSIVSTIPLKQCIRDKKDALTLVATCANIILNYLELH